MMKKLISTFMVCAMLICSAVTVNATTYRKDSGTRTFTKNWAVSLIEENGRTFIYGFNTEWIDEDYTHTYHRTKTHYAYVKNSGTVEDLKGSAGSYAKAEITHHSGKVYYEYRY